MKLTEVVTPLPFGRIKIYLPNGRWFHGPLGALDCRALRTWQGSGGPRGNTSLTIPWPETRAANLGDMSAACCVTLSMVTASAACAAAGR